MDSIQAEDVQDLLRQAIAVDSVNHNFRENRGGESDLCDWVEFVLQENGISYESQGIRNRQRNLLARIEGQNSERVLCFEAHLDTASARGMAVHPFGAEEKDGAIYGRGACDCKGPLAAMLTALTALKRSKEPPPQTVILAGTVDKEVGLTGIQALLGSGLKPFAAIVGAPTGLGVARACRGCLRWRIAVGESPQSYTPAARNAISDAVEIVKGISRHFQQAVKERTHPLLGPPEVHPSRIRANSLEGFLPAHCAVDYEAYTVPGFDSEAVLDDVRDLVSNLDAGDPPLKVSIEPPTTNEAPVELSESSRLFLAASQACRSVLGSTHVVGYPDSGHTNRFAAAGIEAIAFGPGNPNLLRSAQEHVPVEQLVPAAQVYLSLMRTRVV